MNDGARPLNLAPVRNGGYSIPDDIGRWRPHEARAEAIGPHKQAVADALHVSYSLIDQQCRPSNGSGKRTEAERLAIVVNALRDALVDENRAMLEVWWLLDFLGYRRPRPHGGVVITEPALHTVGRLASEFADVVREANRALASGNVTPLQRRRLGKEVRGAQIALDNLVIKLRLGANPDQEAA